MADETNEGLSVKEWLARLDGKLDSKADKTDIAALSHNYDNLEVRVRSLEDFRIRDQAIEHVTTSTTDQTKTTIALYAGVLSCVAFLADFVKQIFFR